jgi:2-polyprenyl-6-hydroxyphenyl methylase/3-demethylubiquinone-9 3-methyltransferase
MSSTLEISQGRRFAFGSNWRRFLDELNERRIDEAEASLRHMLEAPSLQQRSFLDIGCGSGLFSLAARRLGARVHSLDFDPQSVACAIELKRRFFPGDPSWTIEEASVLDRAHLAALGTFDVVYSWGVLHHTGRMWEALGNAQQAVAPGGRLYIALYNDTGSQAARWRSIKRLYNRLPRTLRFPYTVVVITPGELRRMAGALARLRPQDYVHSWTRYTGRRGMSRWRDVVDWVGGYPYEFATPEDVFDRCRAAGFSLTKMICGNVGTGCNEFVFSRAEAPAAELSRSA